MKPIIFSTPMVSAILAGRKTMTRRVVKDGTPLGNWEETVKHCRYGNIGDVLYVRESFAPNHDYFIYKADGLDYYLDEDYKETELKIKWKPAIHLPKIASRLFLKITDVRVERLQEISEDDARAEGVSDFNPYDGKDEPIFSPRKSFKSLWEKINGHENWEANPWVWVINFERIDKPENPNESAP